MTVHKTNARGVLSQPSFWLLVSVLALVALIIALKWTWEPTGQDILDTLWQFGLEIFFGGFFTAALTYAGMLYQANLAHAAQIEQEQREFDTQQEEQQRRNEERKLDADRQVARLNIAFRQELAKEKKISLFDNALDLAIELAYRDETQDDLRVIEKLMFELQTYAGPEVVHAAQNMIDAVTETALGGGKSEILEFSKACNREFYQLDFQRTEEPPEPRPMNDFLFAIQKRVLGLKGDIYFLCVPGYRGEDGQAFLWQKVRFSGQINFTIDEKFNVGKEVVEPSAGWKGAQPGDTLIFWGGPMGRGKPGVLGIATVETDNGLRWRYSVCSDRRITLPDQTELGLPNPPRLKLPLADLRDKHYVEYINLSSRLLDAQTGAIEKLKQHKIRGSVSNTRFVFQQSALLIADAIAYGLSQFEEVGLEFPDFAQRGLILPGENTPLLSWEKGSGWNLSLSPGQGHGRDDEWLVKAREKRFCTLEIRSDSNRLWFEVKFDNQGN